jgi:hypothetical protein
MLGRGVKHIAGPNPGDRAATTLLNSPFASSKTLSKYYFTLLGSLLRPFAQKHPAMDPHCPMLQTRQKSWVLLCSPSGSSMLCFFSLNCLQGSDNVWPLSTVRQQSDVVARLSEDRHCTENHHGEVATSCPRTCSLAIRSWPNPLRSPNWPRRRSVALVLMLHEAACLHPHSCNREKQLLRLSKMKSKRPKSAKCIAMLTHCRNSSRLFCHGFLYL